MGTKYSLARNHSQDSKLNLTNLSFIQQRHVLKTLSVVQLYHSRSFFHGFKDSSWFLSFTALCFYRVILCTIL